MALIAQTAAMAFITVEGLQSVLLYALAISLGILLKRRYFTSISNINGPWLASFSTFWHIWHVAKGDLEYAVLRAHRKYGIGSHLSNELPNGVY